MSCPYCNADSVVRRDPAKGIGIGVCPECLNPHLVRIDERIEVTEPLPDDPPIAEWAGDGSNLRAILDICAENTTALPVMPAIPARILALINDPLGDLGDIADLITSDSALATRVLRLANSPIFGGRHEFRTVQAACVRLGMRQVGKVVTTAAARDIFRAPTQSLRSLMDLQWSHSLATALCAEHLAHLVDRSMAPGLFMGGLVHDIGKAVVLNLVSEFDHPTLIRLRDYPPLLEKVLQRLHTVIGLHTAMRWDLPAEICASTYYHKDVERVPDDEWRQFTRAISLASDMASAMGYPSLSEFTPIITIEIGSDDETKLRGIQIEIQPVLAMALDSLQSA